MKRAFKIIAVFLIGLASGCGNNNNVVLSDVVGYVPIDTSEEFDDHSPRVASDGANYLVVYDEVFSPTDHDIVGTLVSSDGSDTDVVLIDTTNNDDLVPQVAFDGSNYLVVYQRLPSGTNHDIMGVFVSPNGRVGTPFVIDTDNSTFTNDDLAPAVAFNATDSDYLVVYQRTISSTDHDIRGVLVDTTGAVVSTFGIDTSLNIDDVAPSVASNGIDYLVAYQRVFSTDSDIQGALVDTSGPAPTVTTFGIDTTINIDDVAPSVASNGTDYLVAYQEVFSSDSDIRGALVDTSGLVPTVTTFGIDTSLDFDDVAPTVASDGVNYLVVYQDLNLVIVPPVTDHDIIGARVDSDGTVFSFIGIDTSGFDDLVPAVAFGATDYLVAYENTPLPPRTDHDIFGALVRP